MRVLPIYGGVAYEPQVDALKKGVEILVGTPGRLLDLAKQKQLKLTSVKALVLDEADRMLDLGFLDDVERILAMLPARRQTMLFSATMPDPIVALSRRFLTHPVTIHAGHTSESGPSPLTKQVVYRTHPLNKLEMVARILQARDRGLTMIFTRTKRAADRVAEDLDFRGFAVAAVHGDLGQGARERALRAFRTGKIDVLVATDVAARGLDVSGVTHVLNYDCPEDPDTYTHRIGRTGRAGATGVAVTFVDWEDMPRWTLIDKSMGLNMPQPPETYHTSPALFEDLDIPAEISGTLPTADRSRVGLSAEVEEDLGGGRRRRETGGGRSGGRSSGGDSGRGRGRSSAPAEASAGDTAVAERPKRQRRRTRRVDEDTPVGAPEAATEVAVTSDDETAQPAARTRSRRRLAAPATPDFIEPAIDAVANDTDTVTAGPVSASPVSAGPVSADTVSTDTASPESAPSAEDGDDEDGEAGRPRRRRRRGGRGRGSEAADESTSENGGETADMSGGSEAGVGTTTDA